MALTKMIEIDGNPVEFKASAAIPRIYRNRFGRDVYKDLMVLNDAIKDQDQDASTLDGFSLENIRPCTNFVKVKMQFLHWLA